tara:strand:+ start:7929 stop:8525 length:597 start_codon:yes stop_codon:yes gene_type:complete
MVFICCLFFNCTTDVSYKVKIKEFQHALNLQFSNPMSSPLNKEDIRTFEFLEFFDINEDYKVNAKLELTPDSPIIEMKTNTERIAYFRKYGIAKFKINNKDLSLSIYKEEALGKGFDISDNLFLPFKDWTNEVTTYGAGRYINVGYPDLGESTIEIDFNKAYNPYCVYNNDFSCPFTPSENDLPIEILVGMKTYRKSH